MHDPNYSREERQMYITKLGDLIKSKMKNSRDENQANFLFNVNEKLLKWNSLLIRFKKYSNRLPEKIAPDFKDDKLISTWNEILTLHTEMLFDIISSIKNDISDSEFKNLNLLTQIYTDFIKENFLIVSDTEETGQIKPDGKNVFVIGLHPQLQRHVVELLFNIYIQIQKANSDNEPVTKDLVNRFIKLLQLTLISYTRIDCSKREDLWQKYYIPEFIGTLNTVMRFTELKKKVNIGIQLIRKIYQQQQYTDDDIAKLPLYIISQTSMYPGAKVKNYKEIFCNLVIDYLEKLRYANLTEFFRAETQTYTFSVLLSNIFNTKRNLNKFDLYTISGLIQKLKDIVYKYRFSNYKTTKSHEQIDREFYTELYDLYTTILKYKKPSRRKIFDTIS
jgi:hypothetical protein